MDARLTIVLSKEYEKNKDEVYFFRFNDGAEVKAKIITFYESDSGYDLAEPEYIEYYAIAARAVEIIRLSKKNTFDKYEYFEISLLDEPILIKNSSEEIIWVQE